MLNEMISYVQQFYPLIQAKTIKAEDIIFEERVKIR